MRMEHLVSLDKAHSKTRFGAKAANLARLVSADVTSAPGMVLGVDAFGQNLIRLGLASASAALFARLGTEGCSIAAISDEASQLRLAIQNGGLDADLTRALSDAMEPSAAYVVRSSAQGEDGAAASFAGQYDSILECRTVDEVVRAVCAVWASLYGERAISYAVARGLLPGAMAVIVQKQVAATVSGVIFTRDPRFAGSGDMLVEYCSGLGEGLVSGDLTPGRFRISRSGRSIFEETLPEAPVSWDLQNRSIQSSLHDLGMKLEAIFGCPQDIEWSMDAAGTLFALQSRPITTLPTAHETQIWSNANIAENFPEPICTMVHSFVAKGYAAYFRSLANAFGVRSSRIAAMEEQFDNLVGCHGGRLYYNLSNIHALLFEMPFGGKLAAFFNQFTGAVEFPDRVPSVRNKITQTGEVVWIALRVIGSYLTLPKGLADFERRVDAYARTSTPADLGNLGSQDLATRLRAFLDIRLNHWARAAQSDAAAMICYGLLGAILKGAEGPSANDLLKGLPGLASAVPVEQLWQLSQQVRQDSVLFDLFTQSSAEAILAQLSEGRHPAFAAALTAYLAEWGFRSSGELTLIEPTPQENLLPTLRLLMTYVASDGDGPAQRSVRQAAERVAATRQARDQLGLLRGLAFGVVLRATQEAIRCRERARMKQALLYTRLRHVALAVGARRVDTKDFERPDDVFFLSIDEAIALADGRLMAGDALSANIAARRADMQDNMAWSAPDSFYLPKGAQFQRSHAFAPGSGEAAGDALTGVSACGGTASGTAAVVLSVSEISGIAKDQILVTRQTDPGWAAAFFMVKGLVIERGGLLSHGAIIAREYGIPAVVGVANATKLIKDGEKLRVHGDLGQVQIVRG